MAEKIVVPSVPPSKPVTKEVPKTTGMGLDPQRIPVPRGSRGHEPPTGFGPWPTRGRLLESFGQFLPRPPFVSPHRILSEIIRTHTESTVWRAYANALRLL
jgi:hypothetical protein